MKDQGTGGSLVGFGGDIDDLGRDFRRGRGRGFGRHINQDRGRRRGRRGHIDDLRRRGGSFRRRRDLDHIGSGFGCRGVAVADPGLIGVGIAHQDHVVRIEQVGTDIAQGAVRQFNSVPDLAGAVLDAESNDKLRPRGFDGHHLGGVDAGHGTDVYLFDGGVAVTFRRDGLDHGFGLAVNHAGLVDDRRTDIPPGGSAAGRIRLIIQAV